MQVTVEYTAQLKQAVGASAERLELEAGCTLARLMALLSDRHGDPLRSLLVGADGRPNGAVLTFVGGTQVHHGTPHELRDGDVVTLLSPISGG